MISTSLWNDCGRMEHDAAVPCFHPSTAIRVCCVTKDLGETATGNLVLKIYLIWIMCPTAFKVVKDSHNVSYVRICGVIIYRPPETHFWYIWEEISNVAMLKFSTIRCGGLDQFYYIKQTKHWTTTFKLHIKSGLF